MSCLDPRPLLDIVHVLMVNAATNRRFGAVLLAALYDTAIHRGIIKRRGDPLRLTDTRAAVLFGIKNPNLADLKEIRDILGFARDHPPLGWEVEPYPMGPLTNITIRPRPRKKETAPQEASS